jgi:hypothetical protein
MSSIEDLKSQLVIVTGFLALSIIFDTHILSYLALSLGVIFLTSRFLSKWILWLWWKIAHVMGWINTRILLSIVFYLVLLPFAMISRMFTKDPLGLKWNKSGSSFVVRNHKYTASDLENPW